MLTLNLGKVWYMNEEMRTRSHFMLCYTIIEIVSRNVRSENPSHVEEFIPIFPGFQQVSCIGMATITVHSSEMNKVLIKMVLLSTVFCPSCVELYHVVMLLDP